MTCSSYRLIKEPQSQNVKTGQPVTLDCVFDTPVPKCFWELNGGVIDPSRYPKYYELSDGNGNCTLTIKNVSFERDNGAWACYLLQTPNTPAFKSSKAIVTVIVTPGGPVLYQDSLPHLPGSKLKLKRNIKQNVTCNAYSGNPVVSLWWTMNNVRLKKNTVSVVNQNEKRLFDVASILTIQADMTMDKANLSCFMQLLPDSNAIRTYVILDVRYKTTTVRLVHELYTVAKQGGQVKFICEADGNPPPIFQWMHKKLDSNDWTIVGNEAFLIISPVARSHAGNYLCLAGNENMIPSQESTLEVQVDDSLTMSSIVGIAISVSLVIIVGISVGLVYFLKHRINSQNGLPSFYVDMRRPAPPPPPPPPTVKRFPEVREDSSETVVLRKRPPLPSLPPIDTHEYLIPLPPITEIDEYIAPDVLVKSTVPSTTPKSIHSSTSSHIYEDPHVYENHPAKNSTNA